MKRLLLLPPLAAALCAFAVHAQETKKPEPGAAQEAPKPAPGPAQEAQTPEPGPGQELDAKILEQIFACIAEGLTEDWKKTWFVITEIERSADGRSRNFEANFFLATSMEDNKGKPLTPCGPDRVLEGVGALNSYLPFEQRRWTEAIFTFTRDGKFDAKYDFTPRQPAAVKPAPTPAVKKAGSSKKKRE